MQTKTIIAALLVNLLPIGCAAPKPAGVECSKDQECEAGLVCGDVSCKPEDIPWGTYPATGLTPFFRLLQALTCPGTPERICTVPCSEDAQCAGLLPSKEAGDAFCYQPRGYCDIRLSN